MSTKIREGQDMDVWEPWAQKRMRDGWSMTPMALAYVSRLCQNRFAI